MAFPHCHSWRSPQSQDFKKRRNFHLAHYTCTVTADGHHDLRTSQKAVFPPYTLYLYCQSWRSPRSPDFKKRRSFDLAHCTCTVTADGHHDLRTSQRRSFHLAHCTRTVKADGHHDLRTSKQGGVSTLHTVPVPSQLTVTRSPDLKKRRSFHLAHCTCTVRGDGHHDLRTSQRRGFHLAHCICRSYVILLSVKQRMQNLQYYRRPRRRVLSCACELMLILSTVSKLIRSVHEFKFRLNDDNDEDKMHHSAQCRYEIMTHWILRSV
jgi:hypothetical protein